MESSHITDSQLEKRLRGSRISIAQQKQLEPLIPAMSEPERMELLQLIERANRELGHGSLSHGKRHTHRMLMLAFALLALLAVLATLALSMMN